MIKIIGYGWVGKAMHQLFPEAEIHDPSQDLVCTKDADVTFVCVPTPLVDKKLDCSIVEEVVNSCGSGLIVIRSTVMPGTCEKLTALGKNIVFMPEYLGETANHPMIDMEDRSFLIIGGSPYNRRKVIELYQTVYNANVKIRQVTNLEAEIIKLSENRAIMYKVLQCQELYDACEAAGVDFYTIRDAVYGDDPRFNLWFTFVYPTRRGVDSKCIPKDIYGWCAWAESAGFNPLLTKSLLEVNDVYINHNSQPDRKIPK